VLTGLLLLSALLSMDPPRTGAEPPRIAAQPTRVCAQAQKAIFQVANPGEVRLLFTLGVEQWSAGGDADEWVTVQQDITQRDPATKPRPVRVDARSRRDVEWTLKDRKGSQPGTGRYRLVVAYFDEQGERLGQLLHDFVIADCS
jgi:hypothetical protein